MAIKTDGAIIEHRKDIDGLRAVAVLPVLAYHFGLGLTPGGFTGVDIFFVISGFVIAGSIQADIALGRFSIANFYFKRVRRIFPAYAAIALLTLAACLAVMLPPDLEDFGKSLASASAFVSNFYFWKTSGYFAAAAHAKPLLHTWSLSVEEQFYIFAPIVFFLIHRWGGRRWILWLAPVAGLSLAAGIAAVFVASAAGFFLLPTRAWELLLGALAALSHLRAPRGRLAREVLALAGAVLIVFGMATLHDDDPFPGWNALYPCLGAAFVILAGKGLEVGAASPWLNRLLSTPPLVGVGLISYSLYLIHWPIVSLTRYVTLRDPGPWTIAAMVVASLALSWLSWRFIERPFRRIGPEHRNRMLIAGVAVVLVGCALGGALVATKGLPQRIPDFSERQISGSEQWGGDTCFNQNPAKPIPWNVQACTRVHGAHGRILLWGDSFAAQYTPGLMRDPAGIDADVLQYTFAGCPPILSYFSYARVGCSISNQRVPGIIKAQHIDTVVIAARWTATPQVALAGLPATIAALKALGVQVYVIGQAPEFSADVQLIDYMSGQHRQPGKAYWPVYFDASVNRKLAAMAAGARFVDPVPYLCHDRVCPYRDGPDFYYADYGHFSTVGSTLAVKAYFPTGRRD